MSSRSSSPLSSLSSAPPTDDEMPSFILNGKAINSSSNAPSPAPPPMEQTTPKRKRPASPPHEEVLADNEAIAFIVMFRSRFSDAFPPKLLQIGPQDIENGIVGDTISPQVESLLCALLALVLNRKKPVERGHHGRALEEAISQSKSEWPPAWRGSNPLPGSRGVNDLIPSERLTLFKALIMWSLHKSDAVGAVIRESYKQTRHDDDLNQPLSVQPWGRDGDKRRYWLIEGKDDTPFRLYRESNPVLKHNTWRSVAGSIEELQAVAKKLEEEDGTQAARRLSARITNAIPRFEATEEKRKRREYRMARKAAFQRPEPGFSLYEGRTRGKRTRYTYSDEEEEDDASGLSETMLGARRSTRNSGAITPADPFLPTITASGRQVRGRIGGVYGERLLSGQSTGTRASPATDNYERSDASEEPRGATRASRRGAANGWTKGHKHIETYNSVDEMDEEEDASSSGGEWDGGDEEEPDIIFTSKNDDSEEVSSDDEESEPKSLIIKLKTGKPAETQTHPLPSLPFAPPPSAEDSAASAQKFEIFTKPLAPPTMNGYPVVPPPTTLPSTGFNGHSSPTIPAAVPDLIMKTEPAKQKVQTTLPFAVVVPPPVPAVQPAPTKQMPSQPFLQPSSLPIPVQPAPQPAVLPVPLQSAPIPPAQQPLVQGSTSHQSQAVPVAQVPQTQSTVPQPPPVVPQQPQQHPAPVSSSW